MGDEFGYHPMETDFSRLAGDRVASTLLVVGPVGTSGDLLSECVHLVGEVRLLDQPDVDLPRGAYWFDGWNEAMIVTGPALGGSPATVSLEDLDDDHPLAHALGWARHWWSRAATLRPPRFRVHDEAMITPGGMIVDVRRRTYATGQWMYEVRIDGRLSMVGEASLDDVPGLGGPLEWTRSRPVAANRFATTLTRAKLRDRFTDTVFAFRATRTIFRSYQFKPIMKVLQTGRSRLLIADEVGLGKTIEAGLVWTELEARGDADRVLVVCPSVLVEKWRQEMDERFGFDLIELNSAGLRDLLSKASTGRLPKRAAYVVSLQLLRTWEGLQDLAEFQPSFDLVVVDEAHAMRNTDTASFALGSLLSDWARNLIFLTATPVNLRSTDLYSLMRLLQPGELGDQFTFELQLEPNAVLHRLQVSLFDQDVTSTQRLAMLDELGDMPFGRPLLNRPEARLLRGILEDGPLSPSGQAHARRLLLELNTTSSVVTRTRKVEVQEDKSVREPRSLEVTWNEVESAFYRDYLDWCVRRAALAGTPLNFSMQMPLRLASSCLPAAAASVAAWPPRSHDEDGDGSRAELTPSQSEPPHPGLLLAARELGGVDSKFDSLLGLLQTILAEGRQALLFTFSRATLDYLARRLVGHARVAVLHGGVDKRARHEVMADFRAGRYDLVLATRVASEGLDFEFCSVLINYDLPWNPMEVEQRIGRLDRIGQKAEKILVFNFHTPDTIESSILQRVLDRIGVFERSIGELEPIVQDRWRDLRQVAFDFSLSEQQRQLKTDQVLAAIETQAIDLRELQAASDYLLTTDDAPVDGMEEDLVRSGRYVGQRELALLLNDWAETSGSRPGSWDEGTSVFRFRGTSAMAKQLEGLVGSGARSRLEVQASIDALRSESEIYLALDQEVSRTSGLDLLTASHPLTLAALQVPGHELARFASLQLESSGSIRPGRFLVQSAVATWQGVRPTKELWHAAVDLETLQASEEVGDAVFAAVANGDLNDADPRTGDLSMAVARTSQMLLERQVAEESERRAVNDALVETRLASASTMHQRKTADLRARRQGLLDKDDRRMASLFDAQIRHEAQRFERLTNDLADKYACGLYVEPLAVCVVEVVS
jgi:superfamily II DNA or RNA helicase